jgi:hypothetical protein
MFLEGGNDEVLAAWSEGADPRAPVFSADNFVSSRAAARRIRGYRLTNPGARRLSAEARSLRSKPVHRCKRELTTVRESGCSSPSFLRCA